MNGVSQESGRFPAGAEARTREIQRSVRGGEHHQQRESGGENTEGKHPALLNTRCGNRIVCVCV